MSKMYYVAIDVGGTKIKHALINESGEIIESNSVLTPKYGVENFIDVVGNIVDEYKKMNNIKGLAVSLPCVVDPKTMKTTGNSAVSYILNNDIYSLLKSRTNLEIVMENDGNCAGIAEGYIGAAKDVSYYVVMVIGSGIGGSVIMNKSIVYGKHLHCGEFGMGIMNNPLKDPIGDDISALCSTASLIKNVANSLHISEDQIDGKEIFRLADLGNEIVLKELDIFYKYIASAVFNIQCFLDPEKILLGGGISENKRFIDGINNALSILNKIYADFEVKIEPCKFYNQANLLGAFFNFISSKKD